MYIFTPKKAQNVILKHTVSPFFDVLGTPIVVGTTIDSMIWYSSRKYKPKYGMFSRTLGTNAPV